MQIYYKKQGQSGRVNRAPRSCLAQCKSKAFMKIVTTWTAPIAVSLLLHAGLIALATWFPTANNLNGSQVASTISVELLRQTPSIENKTDSKNSNPKPISFPPRKVIETVQPAAGLTPIAPQTSSVLMSTMDIDTRTIDSDVVGGAVQPSGEISRQPSFVRKIEPVYPRPEQRAGSQAIVLAEVTVDSKGTATEVRIIKSAGIYFDTAVIDALKKSIFSPAYIDEEPVAARVQVPFRFKLN